MADIYAKERAAVTLTSTGASLTNNSGGSAGTDVDVRSGGNVPQDFQAVFELTCQWATITSIVADVVVAELYLVPKFDGTNQVAIDTTAGAFKAPPQTYVGAFSVALAPTANTNMRFISNPVDLTIPMLYTAYVKNKSGQTISANWTLKVVSVRGQSA
jgi:hypothetical protein